MSRTQGFKVTGGRGWAPLALTAGRAVTDTVRWPSTTDRIPRAIEDWAGFLLSSTTDEVSRTDGPVIET
jgi:hypothetical protein